MFCLRCETEVFSRINRGGKERKRGWFREPALSDPNLLIEMHIMLSSKEIDVPLKPNAEILEYRWFSLNDDDSILSSAVKDHFIIYAKENGLMY